LRIKIKKGGFEGVCLEIIRCAAGRIPNVYFYGIDSRTELKGLWLRERCGIVRR